MTRIPLAVAGSDGKLGGPGGTPLSAGSSDPLTQVVTAKATDISADIATAFAKLQASGKASGRLVIAGSPGAVAVISSPVVLDLGYTDVCNAANYTAGAGEVFELVCEVPLRPDAGIGRALTVQGGRDVTVRAMFDGGGQRRTATDGAITSGQPTLSSSTLAFTAADVGKVVRVAGAGRGDSVATYPLHATILSVSAGVATLSDNAATTVTGASVVVRDVGLHVENLLNADIDVRANNYAGTVLALDATGAATRRVRSSRISRLEATNCGQALMAKWIEAFGPIEYAWDNGSVDGAYLGNCDDIGIGHWENFSPATQDYGLDFDACNNLNVGKISVGDRATGALVLIRGVGSATDFGSIDMLRATGFASGRPGAAVLFHDVKSINIDKLRTRDVVIGLDIIGGSDAGSSAQSGIVVQSHHDLTGSDTPLRIRPSTAQDAPVIAVRANYRSHAAQSVIASGAFTGGRVDLSGYIGQPNTNNTAVPAVDFSGAASAGPLLDVSGLWQRKRSGSLTAGIAHTAPDMIRGVARARIENGVTHGPGLVVWVGTGASPPLDRNGTPHAAFAAGTPQQNDSDRTLILYVLPRFQPTVSGDAVFDVSVGRTTGESVSIGAAYRKYDATTATNNDAAGPSMTVRVPPNYWVTFNPTRATISKVVYTYE